MPREKRLFQFLLGFEVSFESGAILVLGLELGFEFLDEKLEAADFVAQLLNFSAGSGRRSLGGEGSGGGGGIRALRWLRGRQVGALWRRSGDAVRSGSGREKIVEHSRGVVN